MAWMGLFTLLTIYWCVFTAAVSGRLGWGVICVWLLPIFALAVTYKSGMEINGLMVLICIGMFALCRLGLTDTKMWNTKNRKRHSVIFGLLYLLLFLMFLYSFAQAQIQGYMLNVQGWGKGGIKFWPMFLTVVPMLAVNWCFTQQIYTAIDKVYCKKEELILLSCHCYIANEIGVEKGVHQGYFLEGVQNGITYHFRMTRRAFHMLRKETFLRLQTGTGVFGGKYITKLESPEYLKRILRMDRKDAKLGILFFLPVFALGLWLFWFRNV